MTRSVRWRLNQRLKCECGGYHFPHRRTGGACDHSPTRDYHLALRQGAAEAVRDIQIDLSLTGRFRPHLSEGCPF